MPEGLSFSHTGSGPLPLEPGLTTGLPDGFWSHIGFVGHAGGPMTEAPEEPIEPANTGEKQAGRFEKGQSGNPQGRPEGSRNKATLLLDKLADTEAEAIQRQVIAAAKAGDLKAAELILARIWPPRRGRPVRLELPRVRTVAEVSDGLAVVVDAMADGEVTPEEAAIISGVLETRRKALETEQILQRLERLESRLQTNGRG